MSAELSLLAAFLVGLMGGVHCVGMCGGIVGALTFGVPQPQSRARLFGFQLSYNLGRIASYTLGGVLLGGLSGLADNLLVIHQYQSILQVIAGLFMLAMGLYIAGWWTGLRHVESGGRVVWRYIEPLGRRLMPVTRPGQALLLGMLWGWLPCGLVYSVLIWSISTGSALEGGLLMLSFGLGTLPNLLLMGMFAATLQKFVRYPPVRHGAGGLVMLFGVVTLYLAWQPLPA
ncbi:sulfite exporter TauE/SafE family protein [Thiohalophilus sp.]|uniref:sulfite exporter TauE/SafE family protein n=1 Tax=Thiohalophilus sp. TaxID=3028392 RepID=UPI002ACE36BB|nr:sulfite exporter TauE/SafE family protein [Thiohalophilus sp.]MDZ7661801.1 sulfite exporter TauE/SafE family protein [Thiohalophilus sp.]